MALSALASPAARRGAARTLLAVCVAGYAVTLAIMIGGGAGLRRWFFALLVWGLFVYVPLRILLEAFQTIAPAMRRSLIDQTALRPDRYRSRASIELLVDDLYERAVAMPRIGTPVQAAKAKAGAMAVLLQLSRPGSLPIAVVLTRCLAAVESWVHELSGWAGREAPDNIQVRWAGVRAVVALAALTKVLVGAAADRGESPFSTALDAPTAQEYLDAMMDYCDDLALQIGVVPWTEPALHLDVAPQILLAIREHWARFCDTAPPALEARSAFVETVTDQRPAVSWQ